MRKLAIDIHALKAEAKWCRDNNEPDAAETLEWAIARIASLEQENERLKALIPDIVKVFRDAADKLEKEISATGGE